MLTCFASDHLFIVTVSSSLPLPHLRKAISQEFVQRERQDAWVGKFSQDPWAAEQREPFSLVHTGEVYHKDVHESKEGP